MDAQIKNKAMAATSPRRTRETEWQLMRCAMFALVFVAVVPAMAAQRLYVTDIGNGVWLTDTDGSSPVVAVPLPYAWGLAFDSSGVLYASVAAGSRRISKIDVSGPTPIVSTFVTWPFGGSVEHFQSLAFDSSNNLYASAGVFSGNLYKITPAGLVSTIPLGANYSYGLAFDAAGDLYVATYANGKILKYDPDTGAQSVFFQLPVSNFFPHGLAFDSQGYLYVSDPIVGGRVLKINPTGTSYTIVASGLPQPRDLVFDTDGNLLVSTNSDGSVRRISPDGIVSPIVTGLVSPNALAIPEARIVASFTAELPAYCGFPATTMTGEFRYRDRPATSQSAHSARYAVDSMKVTLGSTEISLSQPRIDLANDIQGSSFVRDRFLAFGLIDNLPYSGVVITNAYVQLEHDTPTAPNPALSDLSLPTSSADLAGFVTPYPRRAGITFHNPSTNSYCGTSGQVTLRFNTDPPPDDPPVADAGLDQAIRANQTVFLNGTGSYDDNTPSPQLQYQWSFSWLPSGSTATISGGDTATPSFFADKADTYTVQLVVRDSAGHASAPDFVDISTSNLPPTSDAGADQLVVVGYPVTLTGSESSDPEHDALTYAWELSTPAGSSSELTGALSVAAVFTPDVAGEYVATLYVSDELGAGAPDSVVITAAQPTEYAEVQMADAAQTIATLSVDAVTTTGNQQALTNLLSQAVTANQTGDFAQQVRKLEDALSRTDGCILRGSPDVTGPGRDWVGDCTAQASVYGPLRAALDALLGSP